MREQAVEKLLRLKNGEHFVPSAEPMSENIGIFELFGDNAGGEMNPFFFDPSFSIAC